MNIDIQLLQEQDAEELYQFECKYRAFFETMVPSRGEDYYHFESFLGKHQELLQEQQQGISFFYLIRNDAGQIVGRMNLVDIHPIEQVASIGYRVGEEFTGQGVAYQALKQLIERVQESTAIQQLQAKTTINNIASQKVLEKNGFRQVVVDEEEYEANEGIRFVYYLWVREQ
ncbi:GNAT family N-acetyltransferase [Caldalkalibacillus mannanilyticus]|uniref:GNAT family N-acetyltransferase n=1 Tax=Caldalkalibacillus mannanilyticus TaxID=1418 RepID=UPI00046920CE|nr:GNAT family N-acetyltransferase [Caldalkalibacillus mannanilyticus]